MVVAKLEIERRKRITQLEKDLTSGDVEGLNKKTNIAQLSSTSRT